MAKERAARAGWRSRRGVRCLVGMRVDGIAMDGTRITAPALRKGFRPGIIPPVSASCSGYWPAFPGLAAGRPGSGRLFMRANAKAWGKPEQQRPLAAACAAARIHPTVSFHALRHTYASRLATRGVLLWVIAAQLGHADTRMVEKHYGHLAPSYVAEICVRLLDRSDWSNLRP